MYSNTAGATTFTPDAGASGANLAVNVAGGQMTFGSNEHLAGLQIIAPRKVDLQNNAMTVSFRGTSPLAMIRSYLTSGSLFSSLVGASHGLGYGGSDRVE